MPLNAPLGSSWKASGGPLKPCDALGQCLASPLDALGRSRDIRGRLRAPSEDPGMPLAARARSLEASGHRCTPCQVLHPALHLQRASGAPAALEVLPATSAGAPLAARSPTQRLVRCTKKLEGAERSQKIGPGRRRLARQLSCGRCQPLPCGRRACLAPTPPEYAGLGKLRPTSAECAPRSAECRSRCNPTPTVNMCHSLKRPIVAEK